MGVTLAIGLPRADLIDNIAISHVAKLQRCMGGAPTSRMDMTVVIV